MYRRQQYGKGGNVIAFPSFRAPRGVRRKPVKGGRWMVRRWPYEREGRQWRAYTRGAAHRRNRSFATFEEALEYAMKWAGKWPS